MMGVDVSTSDTTGAVARYERLRGHLLGGERDVDGAAGLVSLMRRGIRACIDAPATTPIPRSPAGRRAPHGGDAVRNELALVMAEMALSTTREARA